MNDKIDILPANTRIKYDVHGGSLHCFKYWVSTADTFGRIEIVLSFATNAKQNEHNLALIF